MSEFDPPRTRRSRMRVEGVRMIIGSFEHEQQLRTRLSAVEAAHGQNESWYEARENLYDFYARYGKPAMLGSDLTSPDTAV